MGCTYNFCIFPQQSLSLLLAFLLISSFTHYSLLAQGREIPNLIQAAKREMRSQEFNTEEMATMRTLIGSRPPKCEQRCYNCGGKCIAVQVPVILRKHESKRIIMSQGDKIITTKMSLAYSRGDDISNYKPMCWKCKCGDLLFNP